MRGNTSRSRVSPKNKFIAVRCVRILNILLMLTVCVYHTGSFLDEYFEYPTVQSVRIDKSGKVEFPAVTICNNNRILFNVICKNSAKNLDKLWSKLKALSLEPCKKDYDGSRGTFSHYLPVPISGISVDPDISFSVTNVFGCGKRDRFLTLQEDEYATYYSNVMKLNQTELKKAGHKPWDLIRTANYYFQEVDIEKFLLMNSVETGNCYKFKPDKSIKPSSGLNSGLTIVFELEKDEYFLTSYINNAYGIRVSLGPSHDELDIEKENSFFLSEKIYSIIAIKQVTIKRLKAPYADNCKDYFGSTRTNCTNLCVQRSATRICSCYNPIISEFPGYPACDFTNLTQICCLRKAESELVNNAKSCFCPLPCLEIKHETSISYNTAPSLVLDEGQGKFKIYFSNLEQVVYSTHGKYTMQDLLGGIGGHLGLWLGLSLLSSLESFQVMLLRYISGKSNLKSTKTVKVKSVK